MIEFRTRTVHLSRILLFVSQLNYPLIYYSKNRYVCMYVCIIIEEYEEEILLSGLPLNSLWSRLEILRSRVYWYPTEDPSCTDPQRLILTSDVSDCLYPIVDPDHQFVLAVYSLIALKVPMLPFRHCSFVGIQLKNIPWYLDSSEILLAGYFDDAMLPGIRRRQKFILLNRLANKTYRNY